eukprot:gene58324-biopygen41426
MPGAGTTKHPLKTYVKDKGLRHFDGLFIVTANRFTETDQALIRAAERYGIPFYLIRSKADIDATNEWDDHGIDANTTMKNIAQDLAEHSNVDADSVYPITVKSHRNFVGHTDSDPLEDGWRREARNI